MSLVELQGRIEHLLAEAIARQKIRCPACGYVFDAENMEGHVTVWGDGPPCDDECPQCDVELTVNESVTREYEVTLREGGG